MKGKLMRLFALFLFVITSTLPLSAADNPLDVLNDYAGKVWVTDNGKKGEGRFRDVSTWEWKLNKQAVIVSHSVNEGAYMGITTIIWDAAQKKYITHYVTSGGFYTQGEMIPGEDGLTWIEYVKGATSGPTEVRAFSRIVDGELHIESKMMVNGEWGEKSKSVYRVQE